MIPSTTYSYSHVRKALDQSTIVRIFVGLFLIAAASLKSIEKISQPNEHDLLAPSPWFPLVAIVWEFALGLIILRGRFSRTIWSLTLLTYVAFCGVSLGLALAGNNSCTCLGPFSVRPWIMFVVDCLIVIALIIIRPDEMKPVCICWCGLILFLAAVIFAPGQLPHFNPSLRVVNDKDEIGTFEQVEQGSVHEWIFHLQNTSTETLRLSNLQSSCPCLAFSISTYELLAGQTCEVIARLDLSLQPQFLGDLRLKGVVTAHSLANAILIIDKGVRVVSPTNLVDNPS